ncbi:MAG: ABC transporter substrate-binding protein/permease [Akkermansia sp.]|nr:ABC transporter substrate-binding protein/permease [Akkermansia sp.]
MNKCFHIAATLVAFLIVYVIPASAAAGAESAATTTQQAAEGIACFEDLRGRVLAVPSSTVQDIYVEEHYPDIKLDRFDTEADMMLSLQQEKCDGAIMDDVICYALVRKTEGVTILPDSPVPPCQMGVVFGKHNAELCEKFNAFIRQLKEKGELEPIMERWIKHFDTAEMPDLPLPTKGEPIRVAMEPCTEPIVFIKNEKIAGFDAELIQRFSVYINRPVEIVEMEYDSLIASTTTGKADMAASGILITDERAESVLFSDPYYDSHSRVAVLTKNAHPSIVSGNEGPQILGIWGSIKRSFYRNIIEERRYMLLWDGLKVTVHISFFSALLGTILGALICYLRMSKVTVLRNIAKVYIDVMRGTPVLVLLMMMCYVAFTQFDNTPVAIITFAMNFAAYVSEMFRTSISSIDKGQTEAGIALGFSPVRTFCYIVLPQAVRRVLPVYKGELISLIKNTSIVGYVAVADLTRASYIIRGRTFDPFFPLLMVALMYFLIAWLFTYILDRIGRKIC